MEWIKIPNNPETQVVTIACVKDHIEWISVKGRLPEKYERVIVTDGKQVCLHYKQSCWNWEDSPGEDLYPINQVRYCDGTWRNCCDLEGKITHWAYMPEVPKL